MQMHLSEFSFDLEEYEIRNVKEEFYKKMPSNVKTKLTKDLTIESIP